MTEQGKVHYLLVRGYEEFHDEDEWLGIYSTWENAIAAYEREHAALEREKARDLETFGERAMQLAMREEIQIHSFEETTGRWRYHLQSKEICRNEKWNCSMNYFFVPQEALHKQRLLRIE